MKSRKDIQVLDDRYFDLVRTFPLKPLASEKELDRAIGIVNGLVERGFDNLTPGEAAYLDVLSDLVEKYEEEHHPIPDASPKEVLEFLMEERDLNQRQLALRSGISVASMSLILSGAREMNLNHMQRLSAFLNVPASVFIPERRKPKALEDREHAKTTKTKRARRAS